MSGKSRRFRDYGLIEDCVRLYSGRTTASERMEVIDRLRDEDRARAFVEVNHLLAELDGWADELRDDPEVKAWIDEGDEVNRSRPRRGYWPKLAVAAALVTAVGVTLVQVWQPMSGTSGNVLRYVTAVGEQKQIALTDGSVLTLNTASRVLVDFNGQDRRIVMDRGEAYFEIAKDGSRPFCVEVGGRSITALGTSFNVHRTERGFSVALVEGQVAIHRPGQGNFSGARELDPEEEEVVLGVGSQDPLRIRSGTYFEFDELNQRMSVRHDANIARRQGWRTGLLIFDGVHLDAVVEELNRYSVKPIRLVDEGLSEIEVFSTLNVRNINTALNGLEVAAQVNVTRHRDGIDISAD